MISAPAFAEHRELLSIHAELDTHRGKEHIVLYENGELHVGAMRLLLGGTKGLKSDAYFVKKQGFLGVVDFDTKHHQRALLVGLPVRGEDEDPPNFYQLVFVEHGTLKRALAFTPGAYNPVTLHFRGDATLRYTEQGWTACDRAKHPAQPVHLHSITMRRGKDGMMRESARTRTKQTQACIELAG